MSYYQVALHELDTAAAVEANVPAVDPTGTVTWVPGSVVPVVLPAGSEYADVPAYVPDGALIIVRAS